MKIHDEVLEAIEKMTEDHVGSNEIRKICHQKISDKIPKDEYLSHKKFSELFEYNPDGIWNSLLIKNNLVRYKTEGVRKLYLLEDIKIVYMQCAGNIPLWIFSHFLQKKGYCKSARTFYGRFKGLYFENYKYFKVNNNLFGDKAVSIKVATAIIHRLRLEKYIKENWYTTSDLAKEKGVTERTICEWIEENVIQETYKMFSNRFYYISPREYTRIITSKEIGYVAERRKVRKEIAAKIESNEAFYIEEFNKLKSKEFRTLQHEEKMNVILAAKIPAKGSLEYMLNTFEKNARSITGKWISQEKSVSLDELYQVARVGLLNAIRLFSNHIAIEAYIHKSMDCEVKRFLNEIWKERKMVHEFKSSLGIKTRPFHQKS